MAHADGPRVSMRGRRWRWEVLARARHIAPGQPTLPPLTKPTVSRSANPSRPPLKLKTFPYLLGRVAFGREGTCVCREGADRAIDDVWVGRVFLIVGLAQVACGCGCHTFIAASPSVLLQTNIYCFGPCCSWCGRPQAPGAGVERGNPQRHTSPNMLPKFPASGALPVVPPCA